MVKIFIICLNGQILMLLLKIYLMKLKKNSKMNNKKKK